MPRVRAGQDTTAEWRRLPVATVKDRGTMTKIVAPVCGTGDGRGRNVRTPTLSFAGPVGPAHGGEEWRSPRALFLLVFLFLLFLFFHHRSFP
jgi:hypothetical protein